MSRKTREQHRQKQLERLVDHSRKLGELGSPDQPQKRWERQLEDQAFAYGYNMPPDCRAAIARRLMRTIDRDDVLSEDGEYISNDRDANIAAGVLIRADQKREEIELKRQQLAAKQYAEARTASDPVAGTAGSAEPSDPARWDWYGADCPCGLPLGECKEHPRARLNQRPPEGTWTKWFINAGRGFGKTRTGAEWVRHLAETGTAKRIALVAPIANDTRKVMVDGESGILAISRPDFMPRFNPSLLRLTWPNGVIAEMYSAQEPGRLRGPQHDHAWIDEPGSWKRGQETFDMLMMGLRLGQQPQLCVTGTPRPTKLVRGLIADPAVIIVRGSTYDNQVNLAPSFFTDIIAKYEGTRLGEQELNAILLDSIEGARFPMFTVARHVTEAAEYHNGFPIRIAIDAGTSRHTAAVLFQVRPRFEIGWPRITVFGGYHALDVVSADNAKAIRDLCMQLAGRGPDIVRLDPAAAARTSIGPAAFGEYASVFGSRVTDRWPSHSVGDGLDQLELLLGAAQGEPWLTIHPRCIDLIKSMQNYARKLGSDGEFQDRPEDPQHPYEDDMDALRGGIRDALPEGKPVRQNIRSIHASRLH